MVAGNVRLERARPWIIARRREIFLALTPLASLALAWWFVALALPPLIWIALIVYAIAQIGMRALQHLPRLKTRAFNIEALDWMRIGADLLLAAFAVMQAGTLGLAIFPIYILIALRALSTERYISHTMITPFLLGPIYLYAYLAGLQAGRLTAFEQFSGLILLGGSLSFGVTAIWTSAFQQRTISTLRHELRNERSSREARVEELERTTNELRVRMRERHALEEGLRVITSTLSLDDVLNQIVDSTVQTFGQERIHGIALSIDVDGEILDRVVMTDTTNGGSWATMLTRQVIQQRVPIISADAALHSDLAVVAEGGFRSVLSVPLFVGDGAPRGALTLVSATFAAFSSSDARHLAAFATQAGIAIGNAEMHSRLRRQERLLQAVVRDINDGLVVFNAQREIVLANPIGRRVIAADTTTMPVIDRLTQLVDSMRADNKSVMACELRIMNESGDGAERYYQAFGTAVQHEDGHETLTAIVLHDISDQKAEEKARTEFISMVSHELRNPVHSINGFMKVVLQGRAGALSELQKEFLTMADEQIEKLKGRIGELLEFNRLKAGRLSLNPQPTSMTRVIAETTARLALQAEQSGLNLVNYAPAELGDCWCDEARIGQVLTNLVENAIKATPAGGTISLNAEMHNQEIWVRVGDTGVGIPSGELHKVFQRFYRVSKHDGGQGEHHLGLGLAICQQIVEGHGGRLWVESEEGVGTTFTFALPIMPADDLVLA
ncbi:MAG TPA: ATP-binding protein [Roseiflexaceae bacterium]|nr:ATP-binding protein [Roseiflexaceae bacterium]HMP38833.1 ATP-binding protein [Roseiflexaceae bacterium]